MQARPTHGINRAGQTLAQHAVGDREAGIVTPVRLADMATTPAPVLGAEVGAIGHPVLEGGAAAVEAEAGEVATSAVVVAAAAAGASEAVAGSADELCGAALGMNHEREDGRGNVSG